MSGSGLNGSEALMEVRYDVDRIEQELAALRGTVNNLRADVGSMMRERHAVEREMLGVLSEQGGLMRETLEQLRVLQLQVGRLLRETGHIGE